MKLLIDENLPPRLTVLLVDADHDATHVSDLGAAGSSDAQLIDLAAGRRADHRHGHRTIAATNQPSVPLPFKQAESKLTRAPDGEGTGIIFDYRYV